MKVITLMMAERMIYLGIMVVIHQYVVELTYIQGTSLE
jgi:hypothetical protein